MNFAHPSYLWLFLLFIPAVVWYIYKHRKAEASLQISSTYAFDRMGNSYKKYLRHLLFLLRLGAVACLIIVLARPQSTNYWRNQATEGIDIVISLDISSSMLARDFQPDRIEAAKDVASQFISGRPTDNIGLVIFAGESFTLCPMTTDRTVLLNMLKEVKCGMIDDLTGIGDGHQPYQGRPGQVENDYTSYRWNKQYRRYLSRDGSPDSKNIRYSCIYDRCRYQR